MKLTLGVLAAGLVAVFAALIARSQLAQSSRIEALEKSVAALTAKVAERNTNLELQAKCAEQARKAYADMGYGKNDMASYTNHYNSSLNKCFIENQYTKPFGKTIWNYRFVTDAFENKEYGTYSWRTVEGKKYWEVPPFDCKVTLPTGEEKRCHSDDEFTELVKPYMEGGR